ncbi:hypothetical protein [Thiohalomonas denitrificans]|uniref:hypothetical protein n=1 Tax=Thiohalomonas denitrificans TaxID=415747 RepID=UPI000A4DFD18|nr:hypothetical protein [Thiohalomonas denitrificans]
MAARCAALTLRGAAVFGPPAGLAFFATLFFAVTLFFDATLPGAGFLGVLFLVPAFLGAAFFAAGLRLALFFTAPLAEAFFSVPCFVATLFSVASSAIRRIPFNDCEYPPP